jgi:hypothetical protein
MRRSWLQHTIASGRNGHAFVVCHNAGGFGKPLLRVVAAFYLQQQVRRLS